MTPVESQIASGCVNPLGKDRQQRAPRPPTKYLRRRVSLKRVFALLPLCLLSGMAKAEEDHIGSVSEPFYQGAIGILPQSSGKEALN
jgi:hypothetical protein